MDGCLIAALSGVLSTTWTVLLVVVGLSLVIFVHELGHFLAAKSCGVKCEKFYIGFDIPLRIFRLRLPTALCRVRWGETEYGVGILPLGGYVKMLGQDDNPQGQARENERIKIRKAAAEETDAPAPAAGVAGHGAAGQDATAPASLEEFVLDPRSYPAKPVGQRMIIISAGVVMNLVFAVIFAAVAYRSGVSYLPCVLGGTTPGDPAWVVGLGPGDKIVQIGRDGHFDEALRFEQDLRPKTLMHGSDSKLDLLVRRQGQEQAEWISLQPSSRLKDIGMEATLGVRACGVTKLDKRPYDILRFGGEPYTRLQPGDEIVAVDGRDLPRDPASGQILAYHLESILARRPDELVALTVLRRAAAADSPRQRLEVLLPPTKLRVLGLTFKLGPIQAVQAGSPAERAGLRAGDLLVSIQGEEVGDPVMLAYRLLPLAGQAIEVRVRRAEGESPVAVTVTPRLPTTLDDHVGLGAPVELDGLGVAVRVENVVAAVEPGGPAEQAGLQAGDEITTAEFCVPTEKRREEIVKLVERDVFAPLEFTAQRPGWPFLMASLQIAAPDMRVKLTYRRQGAERSATVEPVDSERWHAGSRGLRLASLNQVRTADSWGEAFSLGLRETREKALEVVVILKRLVTGQTSAKNLGGPGTIFVVAASEASRGIPRLLMFLTLLSANLAVLNFLPIPALDGGHMVFLGAEWVRGKPVDEKLQVTLTLIGIGCLLSLMVLVCYFDIDRFLLR